MEERSDPGPIVNHSASMVRSLSKRSCEEDLGEGSEGSKKIKMQDLELVLRSEGIRTSNLECPNVKETKTHHSKEEGTSQITEAAGSMLSDGPEQLMTGHSSLEPNGTCLSLGLVGSVQSSANLVSNVASKQNKEISGSFTHTKPDKDSNLHAMTSIGLGLDLNDNPFYPYKKLGQVKSADASECGSTTGPVEESEPLRMWKEMKQNGFLSSSHGGIPIAKHRGRHPKRKKNEDLKKKGEIGKREQVNKYTKIAAPTGLLSGLNPGIIKHVRNSKQVNSIIEAMLQSEKLEDQMQNRSTNQFGKGSTEVNAHNSAGNQFSLYLNKLSGPSSSEHRDQVSESDMAKHKFYWENSTTPQFNSEYDDDSLTLKLSSAVTMASENATSTSNDEFSASQDMIASLSLKAASVASQWLDLLQQDIKGRLAALRRSKKRVRNVIQTELPCLLSRDMSSNQENDPYFGHSPEEGCPKKAILDMHMARWKSIFSQMDKALYEEGKHLESWLKQVQDMQLHCEKGLKYVGANGSSQLDPAEEFSVLKKTEVVEREHAVRAAAASIYSTCNFIMTKENVPCF